MDHQDMHKLESDIAIIKDAIRANNGFIRQFLSGKALGGFFIAFGAAMVAVVLMWHFMLAMYETLTAGLTIVLIAITVAVAIAIVVGKLTSIGRVARKIDPHYSWVSMVMRLTDHPIIAAQGLVVLATIVCAITAGMRGAPTLTVGIVAAGFAVVFLLYATAFLLGEYLLVGIGLLGVAVLAVLMPTIPPLPLLAGGVGGVFILCGLIMRLAGGGGR